MSYRPLIALLALLFAACSGDTAGTPSRPDTDSDAVDMTEGDMSDMSDPTSDTGGDDGNPTPDAGEDMGAPDMDDGVPPQSGTLVDTSDGAVQGVEDDGLRVFRGIPFAKPPIGDRRFRAPEPNDPWSDTFDASEFGPPCIQDPVIGDVSQTSEDCLTLNVWTHLDEATRPVMVWIHGGGYINGSGSDALYDGANLADSGDVVLVTINYRLGPLGYMATPELKAEDPNGSVGNWGALDQVEALRWIKTNAPAFGGDPNNITVFGESAGGFSVCQLIGSPLGDDLFHKAIMQSGGCHSALSLEESSFGPPAYESAELFADSVGCGDAADVVACLRGVDAEEFAIDAVSLSNLLEANMGFTPTIDGYFLSELPFQRIIRGDAPDRPMIIGSNGNEGALFTSQDVILTRFDLEAKFRDIGADDAAVTILMDAYDAFTFPVPKAAWDAFFGELFFNCNSWHTATEAPFRTYAYHLMAGPATLSTLQGPLHTADLPYVFGNFTALAIIPTLFDLDMSDRFMEAWSSFAYTGAPEHDPEWPAVDDTTPFLEWGLIHGVENEFRAGRCDALRDAGMLP